MFIAAQNEVQVDPSEFGEHPKEQPLVQREVEPAVDVGPEAGVLVVVIVKAG